MPETCRFIQQAETSPGATTTWKAAACRIRGVRLRVTTAAALILLVAGMIAAGPSAPAQGRGSNPALVAQRNATEQAMDSIAVIERKIMVPMRDGKRMATDVYRPKDTSGKVPAIFVRTPCG